MADDIDNVFPITDAMTAEQRREQIAKRSRAGKLSRAQRRKQVLTLRTHGATYEQIGEALGMTKKAVMKIVNRALEEHAADEAQLTERVRAQQLERLDALLIGSDPQNGLMVRAQRGELKAVREVLRIEALRAKIAGTQAPRRVEIDGTIDHRIDPAEIARLEQAWSGSGAADVTLPDSAVRELPAGS